MRGEVQRENNQDGITERNREKLILAAASETAATRRKSNISKGKRKTSQRTLHSNKVGYGFVILCRNKAASRLQYITHDEATRSNTDGRQNHAQRNYRNTESGQREDVHQTKTELMMSMQVEEQEI